MEFLNQFKKNSSTIAGVVLVIYASILMLSGVQGLGVFSALALLGTGVCCFIPKSEPVKCGLLLLFALITFISLISSFFTFLEALFAGWLNFFTFIRFAAGLLTTLIRIVAVVALAAFVFFGWKKTSDIAKKFWYAPAALTLVAALVDAVLTLASVIVYGFYFKIFFDIAITVIISAIYAVAQGALGISTVSEVAPEVAEAQLTGEPSQAFMEELMADAAEEKTEECAEEPVAEDVTEEPAAENPAE